MNEYVCYEALKTYLGITVTSDDALLRTFAEDASRAFDALCHRRFYPRTETRYFAHPADSYVLRVDDDLLAVATLTTDNGDETIAAADYFLMCGDSYNAMPYDRIALDASGSELFEWNDTPQRANAVTGTWGYHDEWDNAWLDSADTVKNATQITAAGTSLTVTSTTGADANGESPRFMVGQLLKIDSEYLHVTAKPDATTLTVRRGANGTTAAAHLNGVAIYIYQPIAAVQNAVRRWAAYLYRQKDSGIFETTIVPDMGTIVTPESVPKSVQIMLSKYVKRRGYVR
jgi:hypothetical protein